MTDQVKELPNAPMAEKTILSAMIQEPDRFVRMALGDGLEPAMFHRHSHVFEQWVQYVKSSDVVEFAHFVQQMNIDGHLDRMGGASALADIYTYAPSPGATWTQSIAQLREVYARRLAVMSSYKMGEAQDSDEAIQSATDALEKIKAAVTGPKRSKSGAEAVKSFVQRQEEWMKSGEMPGLPTGIECIDLISGGMRDGEFWVVGGKPSQGKSVVMLQIAGNVLELQKPVAIFTLEMMANQCVGRLVSYLSKMDYTKITQPRKMLQGDMPKMERAITLLSTSRLWIDDSANQTADTIANEAIRLRDMNGEMGLVVVDYLQLIKGMRGRNESREQEVARASGAMKQLAKELNCPVLSATQLNEEGQSRESKAIQQDADTLLYIADDGIKVVKLRDGQRNDVLPLHLNGMFQRFDQR